VSEIDQQFIEYVVKSLVGNPDAVHIDRRIDEKGVLLELTVDPEDLGRVIGKRGATAQSLRTLLRALGTKNDARYNLKIVDNGVSSNAPSPPKTDDQSASPSDQSDNRDEAQPEDKEDKPVEAEAEVEKSDETEEKADSGDATSDRLRQAREELADLDDLDV
jgi:predicted RNA-binding protein YlqC (UPF0109 family)